MLFSQQSYGSNSFLAVATILFAVVLITFPPVVLISADTVLVFFAEALTSLPVVPITATEAAFDPFRSGIMKQAMALVL